MRNNTNHHKVRDWCCLAHCPLSHVIQLPWSLVPEQWVTVFIFLRLLFVTVVLFMLRLFFYMFHVCILYEIRTASCIFCPLTYSIPSIHSTSLFMLLSCKCSENYFVSRHIYETSPHTNIIPIITTYPLSLSLHIAHNQTSSHHGLTRSH
jgi:hypothetical protein